uniref:Vacuolar protein sorting-associated protein 54 n=1 Tax=Panagrellus redivivus TaxID=6233 RepID=A0A7E4VVQ6_PANRE
MTLTIFTQNLSSVLSDPTRSKSETTTFFVRHWGDHFVPHATYPRPPSIPKITVEHFRQYLISTAKKHRHYLKARKALKRALDRHNGASGNVKNLPEIFMDPLFALHDPRYFNAIFLEPHPGDIDQLVSSVERERSSTADDESLSNLSRVESATSLTSTFSLQAQMPADALSGRTFRNYQNLHNRLEYYHDIVGSLLNIELEAKGEEFWQTVNSYGALQVELEGALDTVREIKSGLHTVNAKIYAKMKRVFEIQQERENKQKLLKRLRDIACLRDAQATVQMLLNQNDFPKALECIETAQEVLSSDLRDVNCFRHLSSQLEELHKAIGKMLQEDFVALIQREFGKVLEKEADVSYQEGQLHPIILGLLRCKEFRFLDVLRHEIVEAVKNSIRQIIKSRIVEYGASLTEFDPSLGNLGDQMRRLTLPQWKECLKAVFHSLLLFCRRVMSIQELIMENVNNITMFESTRPTLTSSASSFDLEERKNVPDMPRSASDATLLPVAAEPTPSEVPSDDNPSSIASQSEQKNQFISSASSLLSMPCRSVAQVRSVVPCLLEHAIFSAQERVVRILSAKSKDGFLDKCPPVVFKTVEELVSGFIASCDDLIKLQYGPEGLFGNVGHHAEFRSPLAAAMNKHSVNLISNFHSSRKEKLASVLDAEQWKPAGVPKIFQDIVDECAATGRLSDPANLDESLSGSEVETPAAQTLVVGETEYSVIGTSLLLLRMLASYADLAHAFPDASPEILRHMIEVANCFNSRTCQLILGAGALQLIGLKTISVKHLALAARGVQLIAHFLPILRADFASILPADKQNFLRHFDTTLRDYNNHTEEIYSKLASVVDFHLVSALTSYVVAGEAPSACFQQVIKQIGKFYNGFSSVMPPSETTKMLLRVHSNFKSHLRNILHQRGVNPHDSLAFGLVTADFDYYLDNMEALMEPGALQREAISDVLKL